MNAVAFRPYRPTPTEARRRKAHGWRRDGEHWFPPWPDTFSYTYRAAVIEQRIHGQETPAHMGGLHGEH